MWLAGFLIGLVWANGFEYAYHRWLLHLPRSSFGKGHLRHHSTTESPEGPEHATLGSSPWAVLGLFATNGIPLIAVDLAFRFGISPGILLGWSVYFVLLEEVHWQIHLPDSPLPGWARAYHLAHHDIPNSRYNVFLPIFDYLCGSRTTRSGVRGVVNARS